MKWTTNKKILVGATGGAVVGVGYLAMQNLEAFCDSQILTLTSPSYTGIPERLLAYKGVNRWYNPNFETLNDYVAVISLAKNTYNFTHLRFGLFQWSSLTSTQLQDTAIAITSVFGSNIQPIIFNQDNFKLLTEEQAKTAVDQALALFPNVAYWELINEPWGGSALYKVQSDIDAYNTKVRNVAAYLKSKITVPMTIGFAHARREPFESFQDLCDILSFHWYPAISNMFGKAYRGDSLNFRLLYYLPGIASWYLPISWTSTWEPNSQSNAAYPVNQSYNWLDDFTRMLNWLDTQANGKPYIINEVGFSNEPGTAERPGRYERSQAYYFKILLDAMRHHQSSNFNGYYIFSLDEPYPNTIWNAVLRRDKSPLPAAQWFP